MLGDIDAMPSVPIDPSNVYLTVNGISDQYVMISRSAYPDASEPIFDTHIVNVANQSNELIGGGGVLDFALLILALQLLGNKLLVAQLD